MNLKCILGFHQWRSVTKVEPKEVRAVPFAYENWDQCCRCGKKKNYYSHIEWYEHGLWE